MRSKVTRQVKGRSATGMKVTRVRPLVIGRGPDVGDKRLQFLLGASTAQR
jgi:hypothetical protein